MLQVSRTKSGKESVICPCFGGFKSIYVTRLCVLTGLGVSCHCSDINYVHMHMHVRLVVKRRAELEDWPIHLWLQQNVSGVYVLSLRPAGKQMNVWRPNGSDDAGICAPPRDGDQC